MDAVRVGALHVPLTQAVSWVSKYVNVERNQESSAPFAYPAYDHFASDSQPNRLNDGDLLTPALLNVRPSISTFLSLQKIRDQLEVGLLRTGDSVTLSAAVDAGDVGDRMEAFIGVLDRETPRGVKLTTLTKILHRKRPVFMPLHDQFVAACYLGSTSAHPLKRARSRTWVDYWTAMSIAMHRDLQDSATLWERISEAAAHNVSPLRLLDIVAWNAGRTPAQYE